MSKQQKKKEVFQPDDHFFRKVMSKTAHARAHLELFYPEIAAIADLESLTQETDEFISPTLKTFRSDIIYRCRFKNSDNQFYFSLIWEHKLKPEENVAIQIGLYIFEFLYKLSKTKDRSIEPILPLIFYNGKENWIPKSIHGLFENHPQFEFFKKYLPNFEFLFKNITAEPIETLLKIELAFFRSAMIAMAHRYKIGDLLKQEFSFIFELNEKEELVTFMTYFAAIAERSPKKLREQMEQLEFTTKANVMSTLMMLRAEGKAEGLIEGKIEGKALSSFITLLRIIAKFPTFTPSLVAEISDFKEKEIEAFQKVIVTKKLTSIKKHIKNHFLKKIKISKEEQTEINILLKKVLKK